MTALQPGHRGQCPHCGDKVTFDGPDREYERTWDYTAKEGHHVEISGVECPGCHQPILQMSIWNAASAAPSGATTSPRRALLSNRTIWPSAPTAQVAQQVPSHIAEDFLEAAAVLPTSTKASAALSRRCLEAVLDDVGEAEGKNLFEKIASLEKKVPSYIYRDLDTLRTLGNRGAHLKTTAGKIIVVNAKEAQWNLAVLSELFDHYYVKPDASEKMRRRIEEAPTTRNAAEILGLVPADANHADGGDDDGAVQEDQEPIRSRTDDDDCPPEESLPF